MSTHVRHRHPNQGALALRAKLARRCMTYPQMGKVLGVTAGMVSHLCHGRVRPSLALAFEIQAKLGVAARLWLVAP